MTDREKLIQLLKKAKKLFWLDRFSCDYYGFVADHLIANGVTFATDNNVGDKMTLTATGIDFDYEAED